MNLNNQQTKSNSSKAKKHNNLKKKLMTVMKKVSTMMRSNYSNWKNGLKILELKKIKMMIIMKKMMKP